MSLRLIPFPTLKGNTCYINPDKVMAVFVYHSNASHTAIYAGGGDDDFFPVDMPIDDVVKRLADPHRVLAERLGGGGA